MPDNLNVDLPFWGRALMVLINMAPIPSWIKALMPILISVIEKLPRSQRDTVAQTLVPVIHKHCSGAVCEPHLVGE